MFFLLCITNNYLMKFITTLVKNKEFKQQTVPKEFYLIRKIEYKIYLFPSVCKLLEPLQQLT